MEALNASVQAMIERTTPLTPTAPLAEFVEDYRRNDNLWWYLSSGDTQNLFEAALEELEARGWEP